MPDTGWLEFTAADAGTWSNPANALASDNAYSDSNGVNSKQSWKNAGIADPPSNAYDYSLDFEIEATTDGVNPSSINVRISIDGGASWSDPKELLIAETESVQIVGGDWGLPLVFNTSFTNANFRVQVEELSNPLVAVSSIDRIRVRLAYSTYDFILPVWISIIQIDRREDGIYIHAE